MASFPDSVKTFGTRSAGQKVASAHMNDVQGEINAIEDGYLNGTARLNSSHSTVAALSVSGGSTFASAVLVNSTAGTGGVTVGVSTHGMGKFQNGPVTMASGSSLSLGSTTRGFLFVEDDANVAGGLFYLRGTGNAVNEISDADTKFSTVLGGAVGSTGLINVGFETDHYTIENHAGGTVNVRLTLIGG